MRAVWSVAAVVAAGGMAAGGSAFNMPAAAAEPPPAAGDAHGSGTVGAAAAPQDSTDNNNSSSGSSDCGSQQDPEEGRTDEDDRSSCRPSYGLQDAADMAADAGARVAGAGNAGIHHAAESSSVAGSMGDAAAACADLCLHCWLGQTISSSSMLIEHLKQHLHTELHAFCLAAQLIRCWLLGLPSRCCC